MSCQYSWYLGKPDILGNNIKIPCGRCVLCKLRQQKMLTDRMFVAWSQYEFNSFVTFTYDDDNLPINDGSPVPTLVKKHLQDYIDLIKHQVDFKFEYFGCGEYGDKFGRPHYHVLFFGLDYVLFRKYFEQSWKYGTIKILPVTARSFNYVSKYLIDGQTEKKAKYFDVNAEPPFHIMSRALGIAPLLDYLDDFAKNGYVIFKGRRISLNKYYYNKLVHYSRQTLVDKENKYFEDKRRLSENGSPFGLSGDQFNIINSENMETNIISNSLRKSNSLP